MYIAQYYRDQNEIDWGGKAEIDLEKFIAIKPVDLKIFDDKPAPGLKLYGAASDKYCREFISKLAEAEITFSFTVDFRSNDLEILIPHSCLESFEGY